MAVLVDDTLAGEFSNSYVDVAYADEYFDAHFDTTKKSTWEALGDDQKQMLLVESTTQLESFRFVYPATREQYDLVYDSYTRTVMSLSNTRAPLKFSYIQQLQFPRNLDIKTTDGSLYIPEPIKIAQCEQAISLKNFTESNIIKAMSGITSESVDIAGQISRAVTYGGPTQTSGGVDMASMSPLALKYISPYLIRVGRLMRS